MEILRSPGNGEILAVLVGDGSDSPLELIELAGRTAHQSADKISPGTAEAFVRKILARGHGSVLEHSCMTVRFRDCSRGFTHELVRHRLVSFTQESTRYVDEGRNLRVVCPPDRDPDEPVLIHLPDGHEVCVSFAQWVEMNEQMYIGLRGIGWNKEDARQVLPTGIVAEIVMTANFREWRHVFSLRCAPTAHWEIRAVMKDLLKTVRARVPVVFDDLCP
ncbi:MAG: FAD-dependent thymidylate synthase [Candidatus Parcubacteria bacterium]|nr:FAD-dependent thymidylate synthase [Candidatus Parcubacteria bacterium]